MAEEDLLGCWEGRGIIVSSMMLLLYINVCLQISAQNMLISYNCTNTIGNYTRDSLFHSNLNEIISSATATTMATSVGGGVDQVTTTVFCWVYIHSESCDRCIRDAAHMLTKVCPNQKEAIGWYDDCMFRYSSNYNIFRKMSLTPFYKQVNSTVVATNASGFSQDLTSLAGRLLQGLFLNLGDTYSADSSRNPDGETIYGLMQCPEDIFLDDCKSCLNHTKNELLSCCDKVVGARYLTPSCAFRFEIYPFMDEHVYYSKTDPANRLRLDWERRYKIIKSVARGILYLHEDSHMMIIHRDLKASNILLDEEMNAKISDFGMARLFVLDEGEVLTKRIAGTLGYMAPEYAMHGLFSVKPDVYSYGVLLLEIICGKKTYSALTEDRWEDLPAYAYKTWKEDKASDLIDPMLTADSDSMQNIMRCIHIALLCVQENVGNRPTMAAVIHMLQSSALTLPTPSEPGFFVSNTENVAPRWSSLLDITEASRTNSQSKPILFHSSGHNNPSSNEASDSHRHLHTY